MKKIILITLSIIVFNVANAQAPKWASKAAKSIFTLTTFRADGTLIASSNGFFIGENGEAISNFLPFKGASKATIVDSQGKKYDVICILGANDIYDIAKFRVKTEKKTMPLTIASQQASVGSQVWLLPYSMKKEAECKAGIVKKAQDFKDNYAYYTLSLVAPENTVSCPFLNNDGEVIGLMQQPAQVHDTLSYAISAPYAESLNITGLSINDATLRSTFIKKALPDTYDQALVYLFMASNSADSTTYDETIEDFITQFPKSSDGYVYRAQEEVNRNKFSAAEADMEQAIKVAEKKDEVHLSYSKLIYQKELYKSKIPYANWNYDKAIEEAQKAFDINPLPIYKYQKAQVLFAKKQYQDAYNTYMELKNTDMRCGDLFYAAAKCKETMKADSSEILSLLDSAVNCYKKPYTKEAAPYILIRAQYLTQMNKYRESISDYNDYEHLMFNQLTDNFYYIREQVDLKAKLYQQALDDISRAITMKPNEPTYYAELSSIHLRVGQIDEAIESSKKCISIAPDYSDGYLFLGLAQIQKDNKTEGLKNLQKAKDLGDQQADELIKKYGVSTSTKK